MSHIENDKWLEAARENFEQAIAEGNLPTVKDIIADVLDKFPDVGRAMNEEIRNLPVSTWSIISPIQESDL
jgi:hypothetical protein